MRQHFGYYALGGPDGHTPIPVDSLDEATTDIDQRRVAETCIGLDDKGDWLARISTVFLHLDHGFDPDGPPVVFETMVFCFSVPDIDQDMMERYSTWDDALEGHARMVDMVKLILSERGLL